MCRSRTLRLSLAISAIVLLATACGEQPPQGDRSPPEVTVARPLVKAITDWDEYTGRLAAVKSVELRARVSGYLQSIHFREGAIVKRGDLLMVIDPRPYEAALDEAKARLTQARARLEIAQRNLDRGQQLFAKRLLPQEELDLRSREKREAAAALEAAEAAVRSVELNVEFTHIKAPIVGRISRAIVTEGNLVSGGTADSTLLTTIVSLDPIHVYFTAHERALLRYLRLDRAGVRRSSQDSPNPVRLRLADEEGFPHDGHMDFVDNRIDQATGTIQARAKFPNPKHLLVPGMFAYIQLLGEGPYDALLIPDAAIAADQAQQFVFVLDEKDTPQRRVIEPGRLVDGLRVIRKGLSREDRVVIKGIQRVRAGSPVTPQPGEITATAVAAQRTSP